MSFCSDVTATWTWLNMESKGHSVSSQKHSSAYDLSLPRRCHQDKEEIVHHEDKQRCGGSHIKYHPTVSEAGMKSGQPA